MKTPATAQNGMNDTGSTTEEALLWHEDDLPFSTRFGDYYYSRHDGRRECAHVFLGGNDLPQRWLEQENFTIGELGFGTGLNFLETWANWQQTRTKRQMLDYISIEAFPIEASEAERALSGWEDLAPLTRILLENWERLGNETVLLDAQTTLQVIAKPADQALHDFKKPADAWFLDGFSPAKNPEMWSGELMQAVADKTKIRGTCASYTAAGWVRRNLESAGFVMKKLPGFGTKREMIAGIKQ